jgi:hypothetical protein
LYLREAGVALAEHLYYPQAIALERKKAAAGEVSRWLRPDGMAPARPRRTWTQMEDHILLDAQSLEEAAAQLNRTYKSCQLRRWRLGQRD